MTGCIDSYLIFFKSTIYFRPERCNGVALWTDYTFDSSTVISTGPIAQVAIGQRIAWDMYTRQGVYFVKQSADTNKISNKLSYSMKLDNNTGDVDFLFNWKYE